MMETVNQMMARHQVQRPVKPENQVVLTQMNEDRSMTCTQRSGKVFTIPAADIEMQAFVVFTMAFGHEL